MSKSGSGMRRLLFLAISLSGAVETCSFSLLFQPGGTSSLSSAAAAVPSLGRGSSPLPPLVSALCPMGRSLPPLALLTMSADVRGGKTGSISRRSFVAGACIAAGSQAASARAPPGIGGGTDILSDIPPLNVDAVYPASCKGEWLCQRVVTLVEGDEGTFLPSLLLSHWFVATFRTIVPVPPHPGSASVGATALLIALPPPR